MKLLSFVLLLSLTSPFIISQNITRTPENYSEVFDNQPISLPELERYYFEKWHYPYGAVLSYDMMNTIWDGIKHTPTENDVNRLSASPWTLLGPFGSDVVGSPNTRYSGRILDINVNNPVSTRVAAASGGLWGFVLIIIIAIPVPLSDGVTSLAASTFDSPANDSNTIILGTGEPYQRGGTGLWRTTNRGSTWTNISMPSSPSGFYRIRYKLADPTIVYAATNTGFYRSTNSGLTWTLTLSGNCTDIAQNGTVTSTLYTSNWNDGLYRSTNSGLNWTKVTTTGIPTTNVGRTAISISPTNSNIIYVSMARNDNNEMLGIYKSTDNGASWSNISPASNILGGQGWYDNVIGVNPINPNILLAGGIGLWRSSNGGTSWTQITGNNMHADQHAIVWKSNGTQVWVGNDGGMTYSDDQGITFSTQGNTLPITQYVNFDVGVSNTGVIFGGSQDNGLTGTTNGGSIWRFTSGGDGGGMTIDPFNASKMYATEGVYGGNWTFRRLRSTDMGQTWNNNINTGIDNSTQWYTKIRSDRTSPIFLYTNSGPYIYISTNNGDLWSKVNTTAFSNATVYNFNVSVYPSVIYASLGTTSGDRLMVYDGTSWAERSTGLPAGNYIRGVTPHIYNRDKGYALIGGFTSGQKVYKTTNRGNSWTNISGDLPNVNSADIIPHPFNDNFLYLGTEFGCYRTTNGGVNWHRWNNGMPEGTIIAEMKWIDSLSTSGKFFIVAGTYGRSFYRRDISGDDPIGIKNVSSIPDKFQLEQNYPNPFNPVTTIKYSIASDAYTRITIYDISGKEIQKPVNAYKIAGTYEIKFDGSGLSSGVYFYKLDIETKTGEKKFSEVKKMMLVK